MARISLQTQIFPLIWKIIILQVLIVHNLLTFGNPTKAPETEHCNHSRLVLTNETQAKWDRGYVKCSNMSGPIDTLEFPDEKTPLNEFKLDDKCYSHCLYKELGAISDDDSKIKADIGSTLFKGNMTKEIESKITIAWNTCATESETAMKAKKAENKCLIFTMHMFCTKNKFKQAGIFAQC